uniref:Uncharacterized protein n=1 Tax=Anguilla anguilla TaxID=7936 RepID=A0A0E9TXE0_ANGAN
MGKLSSGKFQVNVADIYPCSILYAVPDRTALCANTILSTVGSAQVVIFNNYSGSTVATMLPLLLGISKLAYVFSFKFSPHQYDNRRHNNLLIIVR